MNISWIRNHPNLFPSINFKLFNEILELDTKSRTAILSFSKLYNLEYVGELAERWQERSIVKDNSDLLALVLAVTNCSNGFLYDQRIIFAKSVAQHLEKENCMVSAAVLINYLYELNKQKPNDEIVLVMDTMNRLVTQPSPSFPDESHRLLFISLMAKYFSKKPEDALRQCILQAIEKMELNIANLHEKHVLLLLLSETYGYLKTTSKDFKTKGMSRLLQVVALLRTKEASPDQYQSFASSLGVQEEDIPVVNYYLAYQNTPEKYSITGPGFERISDKYFDVHFTSRKDVPAQVLEVLDDRIKIYQKEKSGSHPLMNLFHNLSYEGECRIINRNNLLVFVEKAKDIIGGRICKQHLILIKEKVVTEEELNTLILGLLQGFKFDKNEFEFLENLRLELGIELRDPTVIYADQVLSYGYISPLNVDELDKRNMVIETLKYLVRKKESTKLIELIEKIPDSYHDYLLDEQRFKGVLLLVSDDFKRRLYSLYLNALYNHRASAYSGEIYKLLSNTDFIKLFSMSENDIETIEKKLLENSLLSERQHKDIREKYMTPEDLQKERCRERCELVSSLSLYRLKMFIEEQYEPQIESNELTEAIVSRLIELPTTSTHELESILLAFYLLRVKSYLSEAQVDSIERSMILKTNEVINVKEQ